MKYKILMADQRDALTAEVNEYIADGWRPLGGVSVVFDEAHLLDDDKLVVFAWYFAQAMIKDEKQGPPE